MSGVAPGELVVTQYVRPTGRPTTLLAPLGRTYADRARSAGLAFEAEVLPDRRVLLEVKRPDGVARSDIAENAEGWREPAIILRRLVDEVLRQPAATRGTTA